MKHEPLYLRVKKNLRDDLRVWQAKDGPARLPTLDALQLRYQASRPTISKALAALAAEGLLIKEAGRGAFAVPPIEDALPRAASAATIGFIAPLTAELPQNAFRGIDRVARRRNYRVLMAGSGSSIAHEQKAAQEMIAAGARGLILYPALRREEAPDFLHETDLGVPIILIDTCRPEQGHAQIVFDNKRAGAQMTQWLLGQGHRRIALIMEDATLLHPTLDARHSGYREALREHGLPQDEDLVRRIPLQALEGTLPVRPVDLVPLLEPVLADLLALPEPPTAVLACDDIMAIELIEMLAERGAHVPADLTVVGFDNRVAARHYRPVFATTQPDFELMGEIACEALLNGIEAGEMPVRSYVLPAPLLVRSERLRSAHAPLHTPFGSRQTIAPVQN